MNSRYCNGMIHTVKNGDTLYQISRMYRVPLAQVLRANPYVDVYNLQPGQELCIPVRGMMMGNQMQRRNMNENEMPRTTMNENEMSESVMPEELGMDDMLRPPAAEQRPNEQEESREYETYITDGTRSLGDILEENQMTMDDFSRLNDLKHVLLASDVALYLPKKV